MDAPHPPRGRALVCLDAGSLTTRIAFLCTVSATHKDADMETCISNIRTKQIPSDFVLVTSKNEPTKVLYALFGEKAQTFLREGHPNGHRIVFIVDRLLPGSCAPHDAADTPKTIVATDGWEFSRTCVCELFCTALLRAGVALLHEEFAAAQPVRLEWVLVAPDGHERAFSDNIESAFHKVAEEIGGSVTRIRAHEAALFADSGARAELDLHTLVDLDSVRAPLTIYNTRKLDLMREAAALDVPAMSAAGKVSAALWERAVGELGLTKPFREVVDIFCERYVRELHRQAGDYLTPPIPYAHAGTAAAERDTDTFSVRRVGARGATVIYVRRKEIQEIAQGVAEKTAAALKTAVAGMHERLGSEDQAAAQAAGLRPLHILGELATCPVFVHALRRSLGPGFDVRIRRDPFWVARGALHSTLFGAEKSFELVRPLMLSAVTPLRFHTQDERARVWRPQRVTLLQPGTYCDFEASKDFTTCPGARLKPELWFGPEALPPPGELAVPGREDRHKEVSLRVSCSFDSSFSIRFCLGDGQELLAFQIQRRLLIPPNVRTSGAAARGAGAAAE